MRISELIKLLEKAKNHVGDLQVCYLDNCQHIINLKADAIMTTTHKKDEQILIIGD